VFEGIVGGMARPVPINLPKSIPAQVWWRKFRTVINIRQETYTWATQRLCRRLRESLYFIIFLAYQKTNSEQKESTTRPKPEAFYPTSQKDSGRSGLQTVLTDSDAAPAAACA